jgi:predicted dehydrogenase
MPQVNIAVAGCGNWGPNLIRNVANLPAAKLMALCDLNENRLATMAELYRPDYTTPHFEEMIHDPQVEGIIIATSAASHYRLAKMALEAGKHLLVEKPLALREDEAQTLVRIAEENGLKLMVGHTFLYNPAVERIRHLIQSGDLGEMIYAYMVRVNLGVIRDDLNVMWNLAPHDISILLWTFGELPSRVSARGFSPLRPQAHLEDIVFLLLEFPSGAVAHIHNSWLDPNKTRQATFVGTKKMVVYDDVDTLRKLQIFDKGVVMRPESLPSFGEFQLSIREGDIIIPRIPTTEPLKAEIAHFVHCIQTGETPISDGEHGWQVVKILAAADQSMAQGGASIALDWGV